MEYDDLDEVLARADSQIPTAEVHGVMSGLLVAGVSNAMELVFNEILDEYDANNLAIKELQKALQKQFDEDEATINDDEASLEPMLPDDEAPMIDRVEALGQWCQGMMYGVGLVGERPDLKQDQEIDELLRDIAAIANISTEIDKDEDNEAALMELVEYLRAGLMMLSDYYRGPASTPPPKALH